MILVDLQVVSLDRHYQFSLDETKSVLELITEIKDILCQKEKCEMLGEDDDLMLCSVTQSSILKKKQDTFRSRGTKRRALDVVLGAYDESRYRNIKRSS